MSAQPIIESRNLPYGLRVRITLEISPSTQSRKLKSIRKQIPGQSAGPPGISSRLKPAKAARPENQETASEERPNLKANHVRP